MERTSQGVSGLRKARGGASWGGEEYGGDDVGSGNLERRRGTYVDAVAPATFGLSLPLDTLHKTNQARALGGGKMGGESNEIKWRWRRTSQSPEFDDDGGSEGELRRVI